MKLLVKIFKILKSLNIFKNPPSVMCDWALKSPLTLINDLIVTKKRAMSPFIWKTGFKKQPACTCSKSGTETPEQVLKSLQTLYC